MYATGDLDKTKLLLDHGASPNLRSGDGRTALSIALGQTGSSPVVKLLVAQGADLKSLGHNALTLAATTRDPELLPEIARSRDQILKPFRPYLVSHGYEN